MSDLKSEAMIDCDAERSMGCATYSGMCVHLDPDNHRCTIWNERPRACRDFDCNQDYRLQIVLRHKNLIELATAKPVAHDAQARVPYVGESTPGEAAEK